MANEYDNNIQKDAGHQVGKLKEELIVVSLNFFTRMQEQDKKGGKQIKTSKSEKNNQKTQIMTFHSSGLVSTHQCGEFFNSPDTAYSISAIIIVYKHGRSHIRTGHALSSFLFPLRSRIRTLAHIRNDNRPEVGGGRQRERQRRSFCLFSSSSSRNG